jgi:hypothetical protein
MGWKPNHGRSKPKAGAAPTPAEKRHMERVAGLGCLVCGDPATVHHVTGFADRMGRITRSHRLVVPLCPNHHQAVHDNANAPVSVEMLGHRGFYQEWGIDLYAEAVRLWEESNGKE